MFKKNNKKLKIIISSLLILILGIYLISEIKYTTNLSLKDSSAIYGGELENGYAYAGYLSEVTNDNKLVTCGATLLSSNLAISAAHCIKSNSTIYLGLNEFKLDTSVNFLAIESIINPAWLGKPTKDISIIKIKDGSSNIKNFPSIGVPDKGCHYKIVGYGLNEKNNEENKLLYKPRKSAQICIQDIFDEQALFQGKDGGICYGDSGSPIFDTLSNKIVGIVSSIISLNSDTSTYCAINNKGVMVRLDANIEFLNLNNSKQGNQAICGEKCINKQCASTLTCNIDNTCVSNSNKNCISVGNNFCSINLGVKCIDGYSCNQGKCNQNQNILTSIRVNTQSGINSKYNLPEVNSHIALIISLIVTFFIVLTLILIQIKRKI